MANPSVFQVVAVGAESAPGTAARCNRRFVTADIQLRRQGTKLVKRAQGQKFNSAALTGREWTTGAISGDQNFAELVYLLNASGAGVGTKTTPGGATNTRRRVWNPKHNKPVTIQTLTVERANPYATGKRASYGHIPDLGFSWQEGEATLSGSLMAQKLSKPVFPYGNEIQQIEFADGDATAERLVFSGQTTTGTIGPDTTASELATELAGLSNLTVDDISVTGGPFPEPLVVEFIGAYAQENVPLITTENVNPDITISTLVAGGSASELPEVLVGPTEVCIYLTADHDTYIQVDDCLALEMAINGAFSQQRVIDCRLESWKEAVERAPEITGRITLDDDERADDVLAWLRDNTTLFVKVVATSEIEIEDGFPYRYAFEFAVQATEDEPGSENDYETRAFSLVGFKAAALNDSAFRFELDSAVDAL